MSDSVGPFKTPDEEVQEILIERNKVLRDKLWHVLAETKELEKDSDETRHQRIHYIIRVLTLEVIKL